MMKTGTGLPVLLVDADAESSRVCRVNGLPPWVWATYIGWPSEGNFPLSVLPFGFPLSCKLFVASITLAESEEELKSLFMQEETGKVGFKLNIQRTKVMASSLHGKYMRKQLQQCPTLFWGAPKSLQMVIAAIKLTDAYSLEGKL